MAVHPEVFTVTQPIPGDGCGCCQGSGCPGTCAYEWTGSSWGLVDDPNDCTHQGAHPETGETILCACEPPPEDSGEFVGELLIGHCGIDHGSSEL